MTLRNFIYRQSQRARYHLAGDPTIKRIAEINQTERVVSIRPDGFLIHDCDFLVPRKGLEFVFLPKVFDLFLKIPRLLNGNYRLGDNHLFLDFDGLKIEITSGSELYIINEIFVNKCYQFLLPRNEEVHVIDIGMNVGLASLFFAGLPSVKYVHGYEPFRATFSQAQRNFEANPERVAKIESHNFGLGLKDQEISALYDSQNSGTSRSLAAPSDEEVLNRETVSIRSAYDVVYSVLAIYPDERFVLKIDTEGAEYLIFESLFMTKLPEQIKGFMLEWHFEGSEGLERLLLSNGFMVTSFRLDVNSGLIYAFR